MQALRAVFQGRYRGGVIHADNGSHKPLCYRSNDWQWNHSTTKWEVITHEITCKHCRKYLAQIDRQALRKTTLRERLLSGGR